MNIHSVYSFLACPTTRQYQFSELVKITESFEKIKGVVRKDHLTSFFKLLSAQFENWKNKPIQKKDFSRFDHAIGALAALGGMSLSEVFKIEKALQNHFRTLPEALQPILVKSSKNKTAVVSKANLDSNMFKIMLQGNFTESSNREIFFSGVSECGFAAIVEYLQKGKCDMASKNLPELFCFAHQHELGELFNFVFENYLKLLAQQNKLTNHETQQALHTCSQFLFSIFAIDEATSEDFSIDNDSDLILGRYLAKSLKIDDAKTDSEVVKNGPLKYLYERFFQSETQKVKFLDQLCSFADALTKGDWLCQNKDEAMRLYQFAAKYRHAHGQYGIGHLFMSGQFKANPEEAVIWLIIAAESGYAPAQYDLARHYEEGPLGQILPDDDIVKWYQKAADQGYCPAIIRLGNCYQKGVRVPIDFDMASGWYAIAAAKGDPEGQRLFGLCYQNGMGVEKNTKHAVHWLTLASEQGNAAAQFQLAERYNNGNGIKQNL